MAPLTGPILVATSLEERCHGSDDTLQQLSLSKKQPGSPNMDVSMSREPDMQNETVANYLHPALQVAHHHQCKFLCSFVLLLP